MIIDTVRRLDGGPADAIESDTLECKPWDPHPQARDGRLRALRETIVAFANARGGVIVLGVADRKRTRKEAIQGVGALDANELRRRIYDGTEPKILVEIEELVEPEGRLLVQQLVFRLPQSCVTAITWNGGKHSLFRFARCTQQSL